MKSKIGKTLFVAAAWAGVTAALSTGCLDRPVGQQPPTTKVNFTSTVSQQAVDKVDLLFAIDNSASMGDKQDILNQAVPNLLTELIAPKCVATSDGTTWDGVHRADPSQNKQNNFGCPSGTQADFTPVTDMHIGIVSSSLGTFGAASYHPANATTNSDVCPTTNNKRNDDNGQLVNINGLDSNGAELGPNPLAQPDGFLSWFPQNDENNDTTRHPPPTTFGGTAILTSGITADGTTSTDASALIPNFQKLVAGIDQTGCGLEAQMESWYRFLIQPDPWDTIVVDNSSKADLGDGINLDLLKQRADFLRPDSLVAIIQLSDEDDSSSDPLSVGGFGWAFMSANFPGSTVARSNGGGTTAPKGTSQCTPSATDPTLGPQNPDCTSCGFGVACNASDPACAKIKNDPNCASSPYYGPDDDNLNVRFFHMKERFGVDPQYPLQRYINGLTQYTVPDRSTEHTITTDSTGARNISDYVGTGKCTNPLFAQNLPKAQGDEVCLLTRSTRTPDLIFYADVGGVPQSLLHFVAGNTDASSLSNDDWVKILGKDSIHYDYTGIDPHMIQSITPRAALIPPSSTTVNDQGANVNGTCTNCNDPALPRGQNGTDPITGREWETDKGDLQYACTFDLPTPRNCASGQESCDCGIVSGAQSQSNQPLCDTGSTQIKAKAYPTIRELELAHALGDQGIAASLCPIQLKDPTAPDYGYKPAVAVLVDRLKNALTTQCLPQQLRTAAEEAVKPVPADVPCLVLVQLAANSGQHCSSLGLAVPAPEILTVFEQQQKAESGNVGDGGIDLSTLETCVLPQADVAKGDTCATEDTKLEWCYVENDNAAGKKPAGRCPQALIFSGATSTLAGARFSLQCIQQFTAGEAAGDTTGTSSSSSSSSGH